MPQFPSPPPTPKPAPGALMDAVIDNNLTLVRRLLDQNVDINEKDGSGNTPLIRAADLGRTDIARLLIEKGADVNAKNMDGETPLMLTIAAYPSYNYSNDSYGIARMLLDKGANMDIKNKSGETAMDIARQRSKTQIVTMLKEEKVKRTRLAEEYAKAVEKKMHETVTGKQHELRDAAKNKPKLKPRPPAGPKAA